MLRLDQEDEVHPHRNQDEQPKSKRLDTAHKLNLFTLSAMNVVICQ